MAIGHSPPRALAPQDAALFRAFQANLLSLISHELRTPLMGVLNALTLLDEGAPVSDLSTTDLVGMARTNAQRLHRTLVNLLDLASLESGTFHARLREMDLGKLATNRVQAHQRVFKEKGLLLEVGGNDPAPVLGDAQKLGRALDLCLEVAGARAARQTSIQVRISKNKVSVTFALISGSEKKWEADWSEGVAAFEGGVGSPGSAFAGVLQSEQAFLSRAEEGLGSEFLLIHQILRLHHGTFHAALESPTSNVSLVLELPDLSSEEGLRAVLLSRVYEVSTELGSVALALVEVPRGADSEGLCQKIKRSLFRASDAAYWIPSRNEVAVVLDDCKSEDVPRLLGRMQDSLGFLGFKVQFGAAQCPDDGLDPIQLVELARSRLKRK